MGSVRSLLFVERIEPKYQLMLAGTAIAAFGITFGYAGSPAVIIAACIVAAVVVGGVFGPQSNGRVVGALGSAPGLDPVGVSASSVPAIEPGPDPDPVVE